jgi:Protein of unknown function (DUF5818)
MQSIKRDLSAGLSICVLLFVCALAWGSPFIAADSRAMALQAQEQQTQPPQDQPQQVQPQQSKTFTGTVLKSGSQYVLRDTAGQVYKLDDPESARPYEGKSVKVTGQLDEQAMLIHVQTIEGNEA